MNARRINKFTLLMPPPQAENRIKPHLYIILTEPIRSKVLLVNITKTSDRMRFVDEACILNIGDHDFIKEESFVYYLMAVLEDEDKIRRALKLDNLGVLKNGPYKRVCNGLLKSEYTDPEIKDFYLEYRDSLSS